MNTTAIILVIISALFHAIRNLFTKESSDKQVFLWWYSIFGMLFFLPFFGYGLLRSRLPSPDILPVIVISGGIHCLYWLFHTRAYEGGDLSRVYPIMRSAPAMVLLFALVFLGEKVSIAGAVGIGLVAMGIYMINMRRLNVAELLSPLRAIAHDRSTRYALMTMLSVAAYSIVDKVAVARVDPFVFAFLHLFIGMLFFTPYILYVKGTALMKRVWASNHRTIMANGLLGIFGYTLILIAFTIEKVSYTVGLRQLSIVFAVLMGGRLLREKHQTIRLISALIIFTGAFLICMAG
jgi:uncharacterized membrane protein